MGIKSGPGSGRAHEKRDFTSESGTVDTREIMNGSGIVIIKFVLGHCQIISCIY